MRNSLGNLAAASTHQRPRHNETGRAPGDGKPHHQIPRPDRTHPRTTAALAPRPGISRSATETCYGNMNIPSKEGFPRM